MPAEINFMQFATFGSVVAILTFVISSGERLKSWVESLQSLWLETINLDDIVSAAVYRHCLADMKIFGTRSKALSGCMLQLKASADEQMAAFDMLKMSRICFRKGLRALVLKPGSWRFDPRKDDYIRSIDLLMPRFMWNSTEFIQCCINEYNGNASEREGVRERRYAISRFYGANKMAPTLVLDQEKQAEHVVGGAREMLHEVSVGRARILGQKTDDIVIDENEVVNPFDWYEYPPHVMDAVENARQWMRAKKWYRTKRVPWRRGWLLHGQPGTGKSMLAKCMAQDLDLPVFVFDLASMNNEEFETYWEQAGEDSPCMVLFEDFDAVFHGRESQVGGDNKLTFDCILNCISGIEAGDGIFLVLTTNHIEHIDPSLGKLWREDGMPHRPGRIDEIIHVGTMDRTCREVMASRILDIEGEKLETLVEKTDGMTAAQFTEYCNRMALQMVWRRRSSPERYEITRVMPAFVGSGGE